MPQRKLLLDTNAYLRLARSIHPLLFIESGEDQTCLYLIEEFEREFARSRRLRGKFPWVDAPEYQENRSVRLQIGRKERRAIQTAIDFCSTQDTSTTRESVRLPRTGAMNATFRRNSDGTIEGYLGSRPRSRTVIPGRASGTAIRGASRRSS